MTLSKLTYFCKLLGKSVLTVLISSSFVLGAMAYEARFASSKAVLSENNGAAKKSLLVMIADAEEEVESLENNHDENFDGNASGEFLLHGSSVHYKTVPPLSVLSTSECLSAHCLSTLPLYLLHHHLKLFDSSCLS